MQDRRTLSAPLLASVLGAAFFAGSCQGERPVAPNVPSAASAGREASAHATSQNDGNQPPTAVFKTTPPADEDSVIVGGHSLDVTFNMCQSSDPDPGDELKFWYDFDGDGTADERGHCRATHHYQVKEFELACVFTKVCVSDRQADHSVCHTYEVCTYGTPRPKGSPSTSPSPEPTPTPPPDLTEQQVQGDFSPPSSRDTWSFTASAGTNVTVKLDTVSEETAYIMVVCLSTSTRRVDCIKSVSAARVDCSFGNPLAKCPIKSYVLPENHGLYYLIVNGFRLGAKQVGEYTMTLTAHPGVGPLILDQDNVSEAPITDE